MEKELLLLELASNVCKDVIGLAAITSLEIPMLVKLRKNDYEKLTNQRIKDIVKKEDLEIELVDDKIKDLTETLKTNTSSKNMNNVNRNIKNLKLNKTALLYLIGWNGSYNAKNNEIKYSAKKSLPHEFLHMASAYYDEKKDVIYDGFLVSNPKNGKVGIGLNEGYTELMASRLYRNGKVKAYPREVKIASILEQFFYNTKDMEEYYFNHDLPGTLFYLSQYNEKDELINLIKDIDLVTNTNQLLSQSPNYYYLKVLNKLNKMSDSSNLAPSRRKIIKDMINDNIIMKTSNIVNKKMIKK